VPAIPALLRPLSGAPLYPFPVYAVQKDDLIFLCREGFFPNLRDIVQKRVDCRMRDDHEA
jgi:hypothetical protein